MHAFQCTDWLGAAQNGRKGGVFQHPAFTSRNLKPIFCVQDVRLNLLKLKIKARHSIPGFLSLDHNPLSIHFIGHRLELKFT